MDVKDRKILYELEQDCRQSTALIAKKVGLSKTAVVHRIAKLKERRIIDDFSTITNGHKLGRHIYTVLLNMQGASNGKKEQILEYVKSLPHVGWCIQVFGNWDLVFAVLAQHVIELQQVIDRIEQDWGDYVKEREIMHNTATHAFPHKYLYENTHVKEKMYYDYYDIFHEPAKLSTNDLAILNEVKKKPQSQIIEIAQTIKLSPDTVKRSLKRLSEEQVIMRHKAHINALELGYQWNIVLLSLKSLSKIQRSKLTEFVKTHPNMVFMVDCVGKWNCLLNIHAENSKQFKEILWEFRHTFEDTIKNEQVLSVASKQKHFYNPVEVTKTQRL